MYIALQPVDPSSAVEMNSYTDAPPSPSKPAVKKSIPSGAAISAAQRLLISYALTNSPETIARALPHCDDPRNQGSVLDDDGSLESVIGPESMCIPRAKSCWNILADGFTQQQKHTIPVPQGKGRKRIYNLEEPIENLLIENAIVGKNSWPVLDWLLVLFEQDELVTKTRGLGESQARICGISANQDQDASRTCFSNKSLAPGVETAQGGIPRSLSVSYSSV